MRQGKGDRRCETGRRWETGGRQEKGDGRQAGDRRQTGDRRQKMGNRRWETGDVRQMMGDWVSLRRDSMVERKTERVWMVVLEAAVVCWDIILLAIV